MKQFIRIYTLFILLCLGGIINEAWAYKVTYHILTKPIVNSIYHMSTTLNGKRLEAVRVVDNNATTVNLPDAYKSPLVKTFTYYLDNETNIEKHDAVRMYDWGDKDMTCYYEMKAGATPINTAEYTVSSNIDVYVTYDYDEDNTIADLSGTKEYNLTMSNGFLALNRGRNNRIAVFQKSLDLVKAEDLVSEDFVQYPYTSGNVIAGTKIGTYWQSNDNKNTKANVAGQFHFIFKFEGSDPYNIIIGTAYDRDYAYIEKHGSENSFRYKWYKGSHLFRPSSDGTGYFMASDDHKEYTKSGTTYNPDPDPDLDSYSTERSGYFKSKGIAEKNFNYSTFALLNNSNSPSNGYVFMVSRFVNGEGDLSTPGDYKSASYNYLIRDGNYNNLTYQSLTLANVSKSYSTDQKIYQVKNYVFKVRRKCSESEPKDVLTAAVRMSEYFTSGQNPKDLVPDELKRKYVTFTGAYDDEAHTTTFNTFADVDANAETETIGGKEYKVIWLDYSTDMPFDTWTDADSDGAVDYDELTWYNLNMNKSTRNSAYWDGTNSKIKTSRDLSKYARAAHFAFVGDPYDLKIVGRKVSEDGSGNPSTLNYMKMDATLANNTAFDASGTTWSIVYDDNTGDNQDCFRLKDNSGEKYLHQNSSDSDYPLNGTATSGEAVRITAATLPLKNYIYYIMRSDGSIAVWSSGRHEPSAKLSYNTIPTSIRSPYIDGRPLTFYGSYTANEPSESDKKGDKKAIDDAGHQTNAITYAKDTEKGDIQYIVVRYDFSEGGNPYYANLNDATYNVRLNGQFIYYDDGTIKSKASPTTAELGTGQYQWILGGQDPYAMTIKQASANKYVTIPEKSGKPGVIDWPSDDDTGTGKDIEWSDSAPTSKFIVKSSSEEKTYEVMGATGEDYDALEQSFNIGRPADNTVKMYSDWSYLSGGEVLRFELIPNSAVSVTYHLVDIKNNDELLSVETRQEPTVEPSFPPDYRSPLVETYTYWSSLDDAKSKPNPGTHPATVGAVEEVSGTRNIYVTYTANNLVDMTGKTTYLMKFAQGDQFRQEDGADGLLPAITGTAEERKYRYQAVYPYCNGDGNFFVYGQEQYDLQQQGAASTRTRWAWYVESAKQDPYHIMICSRQQETYPADSGNDYNAYFRTYTETFGDDTKHVVTNLSWQGISGEPGTEYMVLGSEGQYRLVTSDAVDDGTTNVRRVVNSFEQYWKTWNTIRKSNDVLGDKDAVAKQSDLNIVPATPAAPNAAAKNMDNRTYLTTSTTATPSGMGWHCYEQWAYAVRWNGFNKDGDKNKKGWENLEHWFQTVNMGEGYFDFVTTVIEPVLILLDQHGWEIMRKPLPTSPDDKNKAAKYDAIRPYDSPMVKEYYFWGSAKKRTGYHQYYELSGQIKVDGKVYTSTSLTKLPDYYNADGTRNTTIFDSKGNQLDEYVTYTVKDEYLKLCDVSLSYTDNTTDPADNTKKYSKVTATVTGAPVLIQQDSHFAYNNSDAIGTKDVPTTGGMSQYIIDNEANFDVSNGSKKADLWYLMPNQNIDREMGYDVTGNPAHAWASDYDRKDKVKTSGFNSWAFDPYNIQISSVPSTSKYFVTNATTAEVDEGSIVGDGTTNALGAKKTELNPALRGGMDNRTLDMTNATFMAVQDADGNMQLMPRFDHSRRLKDFSALVYPDDGDKAKTYTKLYRPLVYTYKIIDNDGNESLRYQGGGDLLPQTPDHFKSPLANDLKYYAGIDGSTGKNEITESLEGAGLTDKTVYVRYSYDAHADELAILKGGWLTMQLNAKDAKYDSGIKQGDSKPATIDKDQKVWQWKFLKTPHSVPDPYAVQLFNRNVPGTEQPVANTRYAILSHTSGGYALAQAGLGTVENYNYTYKFLNGSGMTTSVPASLAEDKDGENASGFTSTSCTFHGTDSQVRLINDVSRTFNYKIYTNDGVLAVSADQDNVSEDNSPILPEAIRSPLLNADQFRYYENLTDTAANSGKELEYLYGLYDDIVYVRYNGYDLKATEYKVPNVKTTVNGKVARGDSSNDAALDINGELIYNIIWYDDNLMQSENNTSITGGGALGGDGLSGSDPYVWMFEGNDPYAIKIKHKKTQKYAVGTGSLADTPTSTFMLLPSSDDWQYGVLQVTGDSDGKKLTTVGNELTANASTAPTRFIIFGLSTHKVIYHLVIANINGTKTIPYSEDNDPLDTRYVEGSKELVIAGTSHRDLTTATSGVTGDKYQLGETKTLNGSSVTYCFDDGHITLGDPLKVPEALKRPNCKYFYYVDGVYTNEDCSREIEYGTTGSHISALDSKYRGLRITQMGTEPELLGTTVVINVEYQFDDGLTETNNGSHFVTNSTGTEWYTFETNDETPYLANFTYKDNKLQGKPGRVGHYTNEFLWSPVGDPYGFKMYNRYVYKNGTEDGHLDKVMTTSTAPESGDLTMAVDSDPDIPVYELLPGNTNGYFKVQNLAIPGSETCYYIDNNEGDIKLKTSTETEWTFGLSDALFDPYYLGAGNVGGLTTTAKAGQDKSGKERYEEATNLMEKQAVVFNQNNIVDFTPGYYRIFNQPNSQGVKIPRYLSGYIHKTELDYDNNASTDADGDGNNIDAIPMHFYEQEGVTTTFEALGSGFTVTTATQGQIPIEAPEYDPASIFYISSGSGSAPYTMQTQGLYVDGNVMATSAGSNSNFHVVDIGGAVVLLHDGAAPASRKYLHYKQEGNIYDVKFEYGVTLADDDAAKWCMEPANKKGLWIATHSGGEEEVLTTLWYYSSYCVPFDMLIQNKNEDDGDGVGVHSSNAYTCVDTWDEKSESPWSENGLHPRPIGKYNTGTYKDNDYFVPAGTPVLFSTRRATSYIKATIPTTSPSPSLTTIFSARYLEQLLPSYDDSKRVYVFGPKMEGTFNIDNEGNITATLPSLGNTNVGFHINANPNKESGLTRTGWTRNNYYVLHNRIYYIDSSSENDEVKSSAKGIGFVPVIFDFNEDLEEEEEMTVKPRTTLAYDKVYDLQGRCIATGDEVLDGSWKNSVAPGLYIIGGKKIHVGQ